MPFNASAGEEVVHAVLRRAQANDRVRRALAWGLILALVGASAVFLWHLVPRHYRLTITGGEIVGNRHFLAKKLAEAVQSRGVTLVVKPTHGSLDALGRVSRGELDLAFVQGGLEDKPFPGVEHAATVMPEVLHLLARPGIQGIRDLRGHRVNMGSRQGGTRLVAAEALKFSGLRAGIDYVEVNYTEEELTSLHPSGLPEVIFLVSSVPSPLAEYLVKSCGYAVLEIPFPPALALRYRWVADEQILAYTYQVEPPQPDRDIASVGVNLHLVSNHGVKAEALFRVLEVLYSPEFANTMGVTIDPASIALPSGHPLSAGTAAFLRRGEPILSQENVGRVQTAIGFFLSSLSAVMVLYRWFKGPQTGDPTCDEAYRRRVAAVAEIERELAGLRPGAEGTAERLRGIVETLTELRAGVLANSGSERLDAPMLVDRLLEASGGARSHALGLLAQTGAPPS